MSLQTLSQQEFSFSDELLNDETCQCKALFTIGACGYSAIYNNYPTSNWKKAVNGFKRARMSAHLSVTHFLHNLSRYLPSILHPTDLIHRPNISIFSNNSMVNINKETKLVTKIISRYGQKIPRSPVFPCDIHNYSTDEIKFCLKKRELMKGRPLSIAFVGDSQVIYLFVISQ